MPCSTSPRRSGGRFIAIRPTSRCSNCCRRLVQALAIAFEVAQRLHDAGNITDLDLARERALLEEAKLQLRAAEIAVRQSREHLNTLMGLWGQQTAWHIDKRLPDLPAQPTPFAELERRALPAEPRPGQRQAAYDRGRRTVGSQSRDSAAP